MRILVSAFAISPTRGSEPGVGWAFASRLARTHDVTILFGDLDGDAKSKRELEEWMERNPNDASFKLAYVAPGRISKICNHLASKPGLHLLYFASYRLWQKRAFMFAQQLHHSNPFDLSHQLTYSGFWEPGHLWKLDIPFYWGPVAGGNVVPVRYLPVLGFMGALKALSRAALSRVMTLANPRIPQASRAAKHIWCVTPAERNELAKYSNATSLMPEVGTEETTGCTRSLVCGETLQVIWSGTHLPNKALPILIHAVALLRPDSNFMVHVLGTGRGESQSETRKARSLAERLGVSTRIVWHGHLPRSAAIELMQTGHVLVHTSVLEATATVIMEALSLGLPVICHDACGMATAVTADCGIKIPMSGISDSIRGFAQAIQSLLDNLNRISQLSAGALRRSEDLSWERKMTEISREYARLAKSE